MMDQETEWSQQAAANETKSSSFSWVRYENCGIFWAEDEPSLLSPEGLGTTGIPGDHEEY